MIPSSSGEQEATYIDFNKYTNVPNYILFYLFEQKRSDLSRTALKLYLYLRTLKNNDSGFAWPGVRRIISEAHVSRKDVKPAREQLETVGLITVLPGKGPHGTVLVDFNDEQIMQTMSQCFPLGELPSVAPKGKRSVAPKGKQTITNTITTLTNTNKGHRKRKKKAIAPGSANQSPDANTNTTAAVPLRGNTGLSGRALSAEEAKRVGAAFEKKQKRKSTDHRKEYVYVQV